MKYAHTACLGGGVIGASWAALFLASGRSVTVYDPDPDIERHVKSYIERAWPTLTALGLTHGTPDAVSFATTAAAAVEGAGFVQENVPNGLPSNTRHLLKSNPFYRRMPLWPARPRG